MALRECVKTWAQAEADQEEFGLGWLSETRPATGLVVRGACL